MRVDRGSMGKGRDWDVAGQGQLCSEITIPIDFASSKFRATDSPIYLQTDTPSYKVAPMSDCNSWMMVMKQRVSWMMNGVHEWLNEWMQLKNGCMDSLIIISAFTLKEEILIIRFYSLEKHDYHVFFLKRESTIRILCHECYDWYVIQWMTNEWTNVM